MLRTEAKETPLYTTAWAQKLFTKHSIAPPSSPYFGTYGTRRFFHLKPHTFAATR